MSQPRSALVQARELLGWSQSELARRAGINLSNLRDLESGRNNRPAHELVIKVYRALKAGGLRGLTVDQLFPVADGSGAVAS